MSETIKTPKSRIVTFGKQEQQLKPAPILPEEYSNAIDRARLAYSLLDDFVIELSSKQDDIDSINMDKNIFKIILYPMSIETYKWCLAHQNNERTRAIIHYVLHELGHVNMEFCYGHKHESSGIDDEFRAMCDRYDREEQMVECLATVMAGAL